MFFRQSRSHIYSLHSFLLICFIFILYIFFVHQSYFVFCFFFFFCNTLNYSQGILQNDEKFNPNLFSLLSDVVTSYVTQLIQQVDVIASKFSPNFLLAKKEEAMTADEKMVVNKAIKGKYVIKIPIARRMKLVFYRSRFTALVFGCLNVQWFSLFFVIKVYL